MSGTQLPGSRARISWGSVCIVLKHAHDISDEETVERWVEISTLRADLDAGDDVLGSAPT